MCDRDPRHILTRTRLKLVLDEDEYKKREERYKKDCKVCGNNADCLAQAITNMTRGVDLYPWINYDWDYSNYVDNKYSAQATGSSPNGNALYRNLGIGAQLAKGYIMDPNPGDTSVAGGRSIDDRDSDFPVFGCRGARRDGCQKLWQVKQNGKLPKPYDDKFFNENSVNGPYSSSYFFKIGTCPRRDINNEEECKKRGFIWKNGVCSQNRYGYMDNTGGGKLGPISLRGFLPSLATDVMAFSPNYIADAYNNKSSRYMKIQECPETFMNYDGNKNIIYGILIIGVMLGIIYGMNKK